MKKKVLIVDDESEIASTLADILRDEGYDALTAASAWAALDRLLEFKPDIILLDMMMPVISGLEMLKKLREIPGYNKIPVILMSAAILKIPEPDYGWTDFLSKPIDLDRLFSLLGQTLK